MKIVIDVDDTLCETDISIPYNLRKPKTEVIKRLQEYKNMGFEIVICTGRQMRTYEKNIGKMNIFTLPILLDWLKEHKVPFDEVHIGKPWEGHKGFRIDDKTVRPREFITLTYWQILELLENDK